MGATRGRLRFLDRLFFSLLLAPQIADTEVQNQLVVESGLEWTLIQPVHLTDALENEMPFASASGETGRTSLSRKSVGRFLAKVAESSGFVGQTLALSGPA